MSLSALRSRIYDCQVMHWRAQPARRFRYRYFTFCLDLDEIDALQRRSWLFRLRVFRFAATDFIFGQGQGKDGARAIKAAIIELARSKGLATEIARIELVAHLRTFGYVFNPAAFYFCYDPSGRVLCALVEVTNTFGEKKSYFIAAESLDRVELASDQPKLFYVSPFVALDSTFRFRLQVPAAALRLRIDSYLDGRPAVRAAVVGRARPLGELALLGRLLIHPLVTLGVILGIHWQALRLYLRGVPYVRKHEHPELQQRGMT